MELNRKYYSLIEAASRAKNPEFKDLWKRKLYELIKQEKQERIAAARARREDRSNARNS